MSLETDMIKVRQTLKRLESQIVSAGDGADGQNAYITYHDSDLSATPADPTGDGTTGSWHTAPTAAANWMSTKLAATQSTGTWGTPMTIRGGNGFSPVLRANCVGHWKLNDVAADTVVADYSGYSRDGSASVNTNTAGFSQTAKTSQLDKCFDFNGDRNISIADADVFSFGDSSDDSAFSLSAWIYMPSAAINVCSIISKFDGGGTNEEWYLWVSSDKKVSFVLIDASQTANISSTTSDALSSDAWHHVVATYDGINYLGLNIYIDGALVDQTQAVSGAYTAMEAGGSAVTIGSSSEANPFERFYPDKIDNVIIFNRELTQADVDYLYNYGNGTEELLASGTDGADGADGADGGAVSDDVPYTSITFIGSAVSGKVGWGAGTLDYDGVEYNIAAKAVDDGDTNTYIYWDADDSTNTFKTTNTLSTAIAVGNWMVCRNDSGVATPANSHKILLGGLIQAGTITASSAIIGGTVTASELATAVNDDIAQGIADAATADAKAVAAQGTADIRITTFYQDGVPTALAAGDLWVDTNDGNKLYRATGAGDDEVKAGEWVAVQDSSIATAQSAANDAASAASAAQSTADGKIVSYFQDAEPAGGEEGDLWFDTNDNNKPYRHSGAAWVAAEFDVADWAKITGAAKPADNADVTADNETFSSEADIDFDSLADGLSYIRSPIAWKKAGKTTIDGGQIETDTIIAGAISVANLAAITSNMGAITAGSLDASLITTGDLSVDRLVAGSIETGKISTTNGISKNASDYSAGSVTIGTSYTNVKSAAITTASGTVQVSVSAAVKGTFSDSTMDFKITRGLTTIYEAASVYVSSKYRMISISAMDSPGAGAQTYYFYAKGNNTGWAIARSVTIQELKR